MQVLQKEYAQLVREHGVQHARSVFTPKVAQ